MLRVIRVGGNQRDGAVSRHLKEQVIALGSANGDRRFVEPLRPVEIMSIQ